MIRDPDDGESQPKIKRAAGSLKLLLIVLLDSNTALYNRIKSKLASTRFASLAQSLLGRIGNYSISRMSLSN